ncbi:MAG: type VI secretion system baseplate subunit TssK [Chitinophagaceae bacterium]|nr:type VI secretion system baseplate subunit TssK [Chitinophagaceae bacterium]
MYDQLKYFPVNWIDGMKINKDHFIAQDNAMNNMQQMSAAVNLSPIRYGVLPGAEETNIRVVLSADNQNTLSVAVLHCKAITPGGVIIHIPGLGDNNNNAPVAATFPFSVSGTKSIYHVVLIVHPFERQPAGNPDLEENPPRYPFTTPEYKIEIADESRYRQFARHPYALTIGRVMVDANSVRIDEEYIPACISLNAHPDLVQLHAELDQFLAGLELRCSQIVQKIFKKSQQNDLSELALFLCDRIMIYLSQSLTSMRRTVAYEPPIALFATISGLARSMKNTIDLRIGSGKDELMNYLSEWCELNQGELESMLTGVANLPYNHNNINDSIGPVIRFAKVTSKLFETLSNLEFIGKRKEAGIFVKEEHKHQSYETPPNKTKRRFFG